MRKYEYSDELVNLVKEYLVIADRRSSFYKELGIFELSLRVHGAISKIKYIIDVHEEEIIVYGICPEHVDNRDTDMMSRMAEFICRVNYGLKDGCFEFDFEDGEVCYKSYINCDNYYPSLQVIADSMQCVTTMFERYAYGIIDIIYNDCLAEDAISNCEKTAEKIYCRIREEESDKDSEVKELLDHLDLCLGFNEGSNE